MSAANPSQGNDANTLDARTNYMLFISLFVNGTKKYFGISKLCLTLYVFVFIGITEHLDHSNKILRDSYYHHLILT